MYKKHISLQKVILLRSYEKRYAQNMAWRYCFPLENVNWSSLDWSNQYLSLGFGIPTVITLPDKAYEVDHAAFRVGRIVFAIKNRNDHATRRMYHFWNEQCHAVTP